MTFKSTVCLPSSHKINQGVSNCVKSSECNSSTMVSKPTGTTSSSASMIRPKKFLLSAVTNNTEEQGDNVAEASVDKDVAIESILEQAETILSSAPTSLKSSTNSIVVRRASMYLPHLTAEDVQTVESTITEELNIHFLDARKLATQARLDLGIKGYPSKAQMIDIIQRCMEIFHHQSDETKQEQKSYKQDFDTIKDEAMVSKILYGDESSNVTQIDIEATSDDEIEWANRNNFSNKKKGTRKNKNKKKQRWPSKIFGNGVGVSQNEDGLSTSMPSTTEASTTQDESIRILTQQHRQLQQRKSQIMKRYGQRIKSTTAIRRGSCCSATNEYVLNDELIKAIV